MRSFVVAMPLWLVCISCVDPGASVAKSDTVSSSEVSGGWTLRMTRVRIEACDWAIRESHNAEFFELTAVKSGEEQVSLRWTLVVDRETGMTGTVPDSVVGRIFRFAAGNLCDATGESPGTTFEALLKDIVDETGLPDPAVRGFLFQAFGQLGVPLSDVEVGVGRFSNCNSQKNVRFARVVHPGVGAKRGLTVRTGVATWDDVEGPNVGFVIQSGPCRRANLREFAPVGANDSHGEEGDDDHSNLIASMENISNLFLNGLLDPEAHDGLGAIADAHIPGKVAAGDDALADPDKVNSLRTTHVVPWHLALRFSGGLSLVADKFGLSAKGFDLKTEAERVLFGGYGEVVDRWRKERVLTVSKVYDFVRCDDGARPGDTLGYGPLLSLTATGGRMGELGVLGALGFSNLGERGGVTFVVKDSDFGQCSRTVLEQGVSCGKQLRSFAAVQVKDMLVARGWTDEQASGVARDVEKKLVSDVITFICDSLS